MNQFDDYDALGQSMGVNGLKGIIKLTIYNMPWQTTQKVQSEYSEFKKNKEALAQKYNIDLGKAKYQTQNANFGNNGGINGYNGDNAELQGHTYTNLNTHNVIPISTTYYMVLSDGTLQEIDKNQLSFLPYRASETICDKLKNAGATPEEIASLSTMNYQRFEHSHLLFFSATPDSGIPTVFINTKFSDKINAITDADPEQIINLAKARYSQYMQ